MKTTFAVIMLLVCAGLVFAQNTASVTQTGSNTNASVTQSGTGSNDAIVNQTSLSGNATKTTVTQNGFDNSADVGQVHRATGGVVGGMETSIDQLGDQNVAKQRQDQPYQGYDYETIIQHGNKNLAEQYQTYYNNSAYIKQQSGDENKAFQYQNNSQPHEGASAIQTGFRNYSTQTQGGLNEIANITQTGNDNYGSQMQTGGTYNPPGGPKGTILQIGNWNDARQTQGTIGNAPEATAEQHGNFNYALQTQSGIYNKSTIRTYGDYNGVFGNEIRTTQNGTVNNAVILQGLLGNVNFEHASVGQAGDNNYGKITQEGGDYDVADLTQNGNSNNATVLQDNGSTNKVNLTQNDGSDADIYQHGSNNTLMGLLADPMATSLNGSTLDLDQLGTGNTLHLQQTNGASATVFQDGVTNTAVVIQN